MQPSRAIALSVAGSAVIAAYIGATVGFSQQTAAFSPILELEKTVFALGESIRLWNGVTAQTDIPESLWASGVMHIVCPDGSRIDDRVSVRDGNPAHGWKGGWGFGERRLSPGRYIASFEFAGRRTPDRSFEIIASPLIQQIDAHWVFSDSKSGGDIHARGVLLHLENKTGRVLHIAKPGLSGNEVWINVKAIQPAANDTTFVPESARLEAGEIASYVLDTLNWDNQPQWPMITVPAGGFTDRDVRFQAAYTFVDRREYEVTIGAILTVFVGERGDPDSPIFPLRILVSATARFRW